MKINEEDLIRKIFWKFRHAIHNDHVGVEVRNNEVTLGGPIADTRCHVCDTLLNLEKDIAKIFGESYYTTKKIKEKWGK